MCQPHELSFAHHSTGLTKSLFSTLKISHPTYLPQLSSDLRPPFSGSQVVLYKTPTTCPSLVAPNARPLETLSRNSQNTYKMTRACSGIGWSDEVLVDS